MFALLNRQNICMFSVCKEIFLWFDLSIFGKDYNRISCKAQYNSSKLNEFSILKYCFMEKIWLARS